MNTFTETVERLYRANWWYETPKLLYGLVSLLKPQVVVEVGTFQGFAACWIAKALQENGSGKLYCIDNFSWGAEFDKNFWFDALRTCGVRDYAELIEGDSKTVEWPKGATLIFIDGDHSYEGAKADLWKAVEMEARYIVMDDIDSHEGPRKAMNEALEKWPVLHAVTIPGHGGTAIIERRAD